jgi:hypothetical protein
MVFNQIQMPMVAVEQAPIRAQMPEAVVAELPLEETVQV